MKSRIVAIVLPAVLLLVSSLACELPPPSIPPFTHTAYPPEAQAQDPHAMILIPAGEFWMGCDPAAHLACEPDETPMRRVYLDAFTIDQYEVTNARYQACVAAGACTAPAELNLEGRAGYYGSPDYAGFPVVFVTWFQAEAFCAWEGKRLPSEAEWEKAARGSDDTRIYPWGDDRPEWCTYENSSRYIAESRAYCDVGTGPVGSHPAAASPYGVMNLAGNVSEWVDNWYGDDINAESLPQPSSAPATGEARVLRGSSYFGWPVLPSTLLNNAVTNHAWSLRVTARAAMEPTGASPILGFRCAQTP